MFGISIKTKVHPHLEFRGRIVSYLKKGIWRTTHFLFYEYN